jgi:hypothetical protein
LISVLVLVSVSIAVSVSDLDLDLDSVLFHGSVLDYYYQSVQIVIYSSHVVGTEDDSFWLTKALRRSILGP